MSPTEVIRQQLPSLLRKGMYDDARLAAMILLAEPQRIGAESIRDFLYRIKCTDDERGKRLVARWLAGAGINERRALCPGSYLSRDERAALARQLIDFWKAGQS